jgi:hypothetical protein
LTFSLITAGEHYLVESAPLCPRPRLAVKSKRGIATPQKEIELIRVRLMGAERLYTGKAKEG